MSDIVKLLPDSVANQIAAGEVIQRPSAVIKELVENAVDAGATDIKIYIKDAGRTLIQVVDNGSGMSAVDARMALERHATSKISRADDLFHLATMGFRGEALPSICAISQVEIKSRLKDQEMGTALLVNASKVENQTPCVCEKGTSISVRNIFFNVPARRKFLKSDNVELSNIMREFERLALVNNHIRMSIDTGNRHLDLRPATLHQRIHDIWKNNLKMELLPVEIDTALVKIHGYISRPEFARRRNALQFMIVNGRNMRHPYFHKAIVSCYDGLIASDTQPCYFLKFEVDPSSIDVNIHPTKNEIKFEYESEIWPLLVAGIKASLGKNSAVPSIDFDSDAVPVTPLGDAQPSRPIIDVSPDYNPFNDYNPSYSPSFNPEKRGVHIAAAGASASAPGTGGSQYQRHRTAAESANLRNWDKLYSQFVDREKPETESIPATSSQAEATSTLPGMSDEHEPGNMCLQYAMKYIIASSRRGIMVIDQHRAHLKVLYEEYLNMSGNDKKVAQHLIFPEQISLDSSQQAALEDVGAELLRLGFQLEYSDDDVWNITAVPSDLEGDAKDIILRILDSVSEDASNYGADQMPAESMRQRVALAMARSRAITGGERLTEAEMEHLISRLFALPDPTFTPAGRRIYTILDETTIARLLP